MTEIVPEQIIKETTGHRSECVRVYKCTSETLQQAASRTVGGESSLKQVQIDSIDSEEDDKKDVDFLSYKKMLENVNKTKEEMRKKLYPRNRLRAQRLLNKAKKLTIDVNLNIKMSK